jgi:hypothetical protein
MYSLSSGRRFFFLQIRTQGTRRFTRERIRNVSCFSAMRNGDKDSVNAIYRLLRFGGSWHLYGVSDAQFRKQLEDEYGVKIAVPQST